MAHNSINSINIVNINFRFCVTVSRLTKYKCESRPMLGFQNITCISNAELFQEVEYTFKDFKPNNFVVLLLTTYNFEYHLILYEMLCFQVLNGLKIL